MTTIEVLILIGFVIVALAIVGISDVDACALLSTRKV